MQEDSIKENIEKYRIQRGLSQQEVADFLGLSRNGYRKLEKGNTRLLNENLGPLADALGCRVEDFFVPYGADSRSDLSSLLSIKQKRITELEGMLREQTELIEFYRGKK